MNDITKDMREKTIVLLSMIAALVLKKRIEKKDVG